MIFFPSLISNFCVYVYICPYIPFSRFFIWKSSQNENEKRNIFLLASADDTVYMCVWY